MRKIQVDFVNNTASEILEVDDSSPLQAPVILGDAGYLSIVLGNGNTVYYNWEHVRSIRTLPKETPVPPKK